MEKVVWKGTFEEAEERDHQFWAAQTDKERLAAMLRMSAVYFGVPDEPIKKIAIKRKFGDEEE